MIELDKRIIEGKRPLTAFDVMESKFIGTDCYFSDNASDYGDLSNCQLGCLLSADGMTGVFNAKKNNSYANFNYCLPCEWVKEKKSEPKYRPYTIKDFEKAFLNGEFEDFIIFRDKHEPDDIYTMRYNGNFVRGKFEYICLGAKNFSFESLFENYEVADYDGDWQPFGILEE